LGDSLNPALPAEDPWFLCDDHKLAMKRWILLAAGEKTFETLAGSIVVNSIFLQSQIREFQGCHAKLNILCKAERAGIFTSSGIGTGSSVSKFFSVLNNFSKSTIYIVGQRLRNNGSIRK
jgi:hypothetical protein